MENWLTILPSFPDICEADAPEDMLSTDCYSSPADWDLNEIDTNPLNFDITGEFLKQEHPPCPPEPKKKSRGKWSPTLDGQLKKLAELYDFNWVKIAEFFENKTHT